MGEFAEAVRDRLRDSLAERRPSLDWGTEHRIRRTPVDVAGRGPDRFVAVELEWRRADPANNTAKLFYYAAEGEFDDYDEVVVCQLFSGYYDLASGGVSVSSVEQRSADRSSGRRGGFTASNETAAPSRSPREDDASGGSTDSSVGVSSKREVAEFVGETAAESVERVAFHPVTLPIDPPKRGGERPDGWRARADESAEAIASLL